MDSLKKALLRKEKRYQKLLESLPPSAKDPPTARLEISNCNGVVRYYRICFDPEKKTKKKIYLNPEEKRTAQKLAQAAYEERLQKVLQNNLWRIRNLIKNYEDNEITRIYASLSPDRKKLVKPLEMTLEQWKTLPNNGLDYQGEDRKILTNNGERVRSKSEKILADLFRDRGLIYKYECPLSLKDGTLVYPDFTFFSQSLQKEIYWEHDGMMDDPDYVEKAIKKIKNYERCGIFRGVNLIVTYETSTNSLDSRWANILIERLLLPVMR